MSIEFTILTMMKRWGGTVHLALGASIPETGGLNQSALHWDMVCDLRKGVKFALMESYSRKMENS